MSESLMAYLASLAGQGQPGGETTRLGPQQEAQFRAWAQANGITDVDDPRSHYDYRGYWRDVASRGQDQRQRNPGDGLLHFPDTYKQHGHPTFSVESQYSTGDADGGTWSGETYSPAPRGSSHLSPAAPGAHRENAIPLAPLSVLARRGR
jgi:hypothetical protein